MYTTFSIFFSIHPLRHTGYFHFFVVVNNAARNMRMHVSLQYTVSISFGYKLSCRIAGSYECPIFNYFEKSPY